MGRFQLIHLERVWGVRCYYKGEIERRKDIT